MGTLYPIGIDIAFPFFIDTDARDSMGWFFNQAC